jgi:type IV pilus assembly protein PilY1
MNTTFFSKYPLLARWVSMWMVFFMAFPSSLPVWAATDLADKPLQTVAVAAPNLFYTLDDSTSMGADYTPEFIKGGYCRNYTGTATVNGLSGVYAGTFGAACGTPSSNLTFEHAKTITRAYQLSSSGAQDIYTSVNERIAHPPVMNSSFNRLFYDPLEEYEPPFKPDGTKFPRMTAENTTNWTEVYRDQYWIANPQRFNLAAAKAYAHLYCNSDWNPSVKYNSTTGKFDFNSDECRFNAEVYPASSSALPSWLRASAAAVVDDLYPTNRGLGEPDSFRYPPGSNLYCDASKFTPPATGTGAGQQGCFPKVPDSSGNLIQTASGNWHNMLQQWSRTNNAAEYKDDTSCVCNRTQEYKPEYKKTTYGICKKTFNLGTDCVMVTQKFGECTREMQTCKKDVPTTTYPTYCYKGAWQCNSNSWRRGGNITAADYNCTGGVCTPIVDIAGKIGATCLSSEATSERPCNYICTGGAWNTTAGGSCRPNGTQAGYDACISSGHTCSSPTPSTFPDTKYAYSSVQKTQFENDGYSCTQGTDRKTPSNQNDYNQMMAVTDYKWTCPAPTPSADYSNLCQWSTEAGRQNCIDRGYTCGSTIPGNPGGTIELTCDRNAIGTSENCGKPELGWTCEPDKEENVPAVEAVWRNWNLSFMPCRRNVVTSCTQEYIDDANGDGNICRHNRKTYAPVYPDTNSNPATNTTGGGTLSSFSTNASLIPNSGSFSAPYTTMISCGNVLGNPPVATNVPFHYFRTKVSWCAGEYPNNPENVKLGRVGKADPTSGCQPHRDSAHLYPHFSNYLGDPNGDVFTKVVLDISERYTHSGFKHKDEYGIVQRERSWDEEMTNYATWFAYYRTRALAAKTVTSLAFFGDDVIDRSKSLRVGFQALNYENNKNNFLAMKEFFDANGNLVAHSTAFLNAVFKSELAMSRLTPTASAMYRVGEYFSNNTSGEGKFSEVADPVIASCQKNFHVLFTDGATDQDNPEDYNINVAPHYRNPYTLPAKDEDKTVPSYQHLLKEDDDGNFKPYLHVYGSVEPLTPGQKWPRPILDSTPGTTGGLADLATYYWVRNLRENDDDFKDSEGKPILNVPKSPTDPANWPRVNFSALAMGVEGSLPSVGSSATLARIKLENTSDELDWPRIQNPLAPGLSPDRNDAKAIDDLWHATINGFGTFANTQSPSELLKGLAEALAAVQSASGTRAADVYEKTDMSKLEQDSYVYRVFFLPGWSGDLVRTAVDPETGYMKDKDEWSAGDSLTNRLTPKAGSLEPWNNNRIIFTRNGSGPTSFRYSTLSNPQREALTPAKLGNKTKAEMQEKVVEFLRGSNEMENDKDGGFRKRNMDPSAARSNPLGDIVNARPVFVDKMGQAINYEEASNPGYAAFREGLSTLSGRVSAVYAAANDGMLHAFDAETGEELWAYIPSVLFNNDEKRGLVNLTVPNFGNPSFEHYYYVDATPKVFDVKMGLPGQEKWRSLLVGGLGKGGKAYYALDVTQPQIDNSLGGNAAAIELGEAAKRAKWEFTDDRLGYTYGRAILVKLDFKGKEEWKVIVPSGYNNDDGKGYIFILDPETGRLDATLSTGSGSPGAPSGLAHIIGYVPSEKNQLVKEVYGGDLNGDFWRFDLGGAASAGDLDGGSAKLLARFGTPTNPQPVTTEPRVEIDVFDGTADKRRFVFVGTGKLLGNSDLETGYQQAFYAILDGNQDGPAPISSSSGHPITTANLENVTNDYKEGVKVTPPQKGWYLELGDNKERVIYDPTAAIGIISFIGTIPGGDLLCDTGQPGFVYSRKFGTGQSVLTDENGVVLASKETQNGAVGGKGVRPKKGVKSIYTDALGTRNRGGKRDDFSTDFDDTLSAAELKPARITWRTITK